MAWDTGKRVLQAGVGKGRAGKGGVLAVSTVAVGNVGVGIDDLISLIVPANTLYKTGQGLRITAWGRYGATGNNKQLIMLFGGTTVADGGIVTQNGKAWRIETMIFRTGASAQDSLGAVGHDTASTRTFVALTKTDTADIIVKMTGEATADNDVLAEGMMIEVLAAP